MLFLKTVLVLVNGKKSFTEEEVKKYNLTETRAKFMKTTTPIVWFTQW
jgi:hypothetical protein